MIKPNTIQQIMETARIEEVVGDYVQLKKRGVNLMGLCPFHNEKSPSFTVSPVKGIFKCFGCGKGGDSVTFVMEHDQLSYPEALKTLAKKYNIEIEEDISYSPEFEAEKSLRESLYVLTAKASEIMTKWLLSTDEGQSIGLSYFKERRLEKNIIEKFALGYAFEQHNALCTTLLNEGFQQEYIIQTGLGLISQQGQLTDRFRGRVMFPIHNLTGRVIGFGGRVLKTDAKTAKYVNSPESDIYHKSNVLYGLFQAKKAIREQDKCYLVEGYMDVIAMHRAGLENVVASSGTSLTIEQARLIKRFTDNVTILYDGDKAGIKAAVRGIDIILAEGLNVRLALFPEGTDPDEYLNKVGSSTFGEYLQQAEVDFITYRTNMLSEEAKLDPIQKTSLVRELLQSIVLIPDAIKRDLYLKQCSTKFDIGEVILIKELNNLLRKAVNSNEKHEQIVVEPTEDESINKQHAFEEKVPILDTTEMNVVRLLLRYNTLAIDEGEHTVGKYIIENTEDISFNDTDCQYIINHYKAKINMGITPNFSEIMAEGNASINSTIALLLSDKYEISDNWKTKHKIHIPTEEEVIQASVHNALLHLKLKKVSQLLDEKKILMRTTTDQTELTNLIRDFQHLTEVKIEISKALENVVVR